MPNFVPTIKPGTNYTVVKGDTLSGIAYAAYGDASETAWRVIYNANKQTIGSEPGHIGIGQVLSIPPLPTPSSTVQPIKPGTNYTVVKGDTLSGIAYSAYGDGTEAAWRVIYNANKQAIGSEPGHIGIGQVLYIPPRTR